MKIERLEEVDSTLRYIKRYLDGDEDVIITAKRQTGGMGTKGRSFASDEGGVYFTALTFYDLPAKDAFRVMAHAAVTVCRTAEEFGVLPEIKWPNDVLVNKRKLAGILIENTFSGDRLRCSTVGIGLNAENDVSALGGIAISLTEAAGKRVSEEAAREALIRHFLKDSSFDEYRSYVRFLGEEVRVIEGEREFTALAKEITADGRLVIEKRGSLRTLSAAEISLRLEGMK